VARLIASKLSDRLGQQVLPDNRAGASGMIAAELVVRAPPDGYTLLLISLAHAVNPWIYKINYDPLRSLTLVAALGNGASVLTVHPSVPARSVKELIALAKSKPRDLAFAHAGVGSFTHTASVLFAMMAGIDVMQVPFKGGGPAMIDVMGGHSHLLMNSYLASVPHIRSGKLRPLGVTDTQRTPLLPDVPTIAESGVPGFDYSLWVAMFAPAGTPADVVAKIAADVARASQTPELRERLTALGAESMTLSGPELRKFVRDEIAESAKVIKAAGIKPQ
jgi:tripartite-type tricarboxylate transporter receptor subunit TctC